MNGWKEKIESFLKSEKGGWILLAAGIVGIVLIFFSGNISDKNGAKTSEKTVEVNLTAVNEYTAMLEEKLEKIIGNIAGAGESKVMLTVETGVEYVYAKDIKVNSEYNHNVKGDEENTKETHEEETKFLELDDGALLITEKQPSVKGVVVVCKGADDPIVCQRVLTAVMTVLGVNSTKVCVVAKE